jgi:hypothetical protein
MLGVLAMSHIVQSLFGYFSQTKRVVQFAVSEQASVGGNRRSVELEPQAAIKFDS